MDDGFNMEARYGPETAVDECDDYGAQPVIIFAIDENARGKTDGFFVLTGLIDKRIGESRQ